MATQARHHSSSSSSSSQDNHVFLSFSGQDTFNTITSILNSILCSEGLRTYMANEELKLGQEIGPALFTAIEQSAISIPIFSENYGSLKWCLRELVKMLQCHKEKKQTILPIFYYVEPNEVQDQTGSFGKAWEAFKIRQKPEDVDEWRTTLEEVGRMKGLLLNETHNHGYHLQGCNFCITLASFPLLLMIIVAIYRSNQLKQFTKGLHRTAQGPPKLVSLHMDMAIHTYEDIMRSTENSSEKCMLVVVLVHICINNLMLDLRYPLRIVRINSAGFLPLALFLLPFSALCTNVH